MASPETAARMISLPGGSAVGEFVALIGARPRLVVRERGLA